MKLDLFWPRKRMASCFDFRMRTSSFDLHHLTQRHKLSKFGRLFRSKSDTSVKSESPKSSPKASPKGSPNSHVRRRFVRVVKNEEAAGEEYENPHIIRRYTQEYVQEQWSHQRPASVDEQNLPYVVTGHTILKKHSSVDSVSSSNQGNQSPQLHKHTSFKEEVEIIEFDKKCKVNIPCTTHTEKLQDTEHEIIHSDVCPHCVKMKKQNVKDVCQQSSSDSEQIDGETSPQKSDKTPNAHTTSQPQGNIAEDKRETDPPDNDSDSNSCDETSTSEGQELEVIYEKDSSKDIIVNTVVNTSLPVNYEEKSRGLQQHLVTNS